MVGENELMVSDEMKKQMKKNEEEREKIKKDKEEKTKVKNLYFSICAVLVSSL